MSMALKLGTISCDESTINKDGKISWDSGGVRTCDPYSDVNFNNETSLIVAYKPGDEAFNYAEVISNSQTAETKYYYVRNRTMAPGGKIIFILEIDPLYTYKDDIYELPCICMRTSDVSESSDKVDAYVYDSKLPVRAYKAVDEYAADWVVGTEPGTKVASFSLEGEKNVIITVG